MTEEEQARRIQRSTDGLRLLCLWYIRLWTGGSNSQIATVLRNMSAKRVARIVNLRIGYHPDMRSPDWWESTEELRYIKMRWWMGGKVK
jgi:hypothetical protein